MKFILWTLVWFAVSGGITKWISIKTIGPVDYHNFISKKPDVAVIGAFIIQVVAWIWLYQLFVI